MNILVVHNPKSGNSQQLDEIKKAFATHNIEPDYIAITDTKLGHVIKTTVKTKGATVVAAGGDGTINAVASYLYGTPCKLGVIPAGTLNHFAKTLNVPLDIPQAVKRIVKGAHQQIDIGTVNDHVFVNNTSIGFYPRSLRVRDAYSQPLGKWPAAMLGFIKTALRPHRYRIELSIDGKEQTLRTPFIFIGNNSYTSGTGVSERDSVQTGKLAVYVIKTTSVFGTMRTLWHLAFTKKRRTKDFTVHLTDACTIRTKHHRKMHVACDGEVLTLATPLHYRSEPKSLRVIC